MEQMLADLSPQEWASPSRCEAWSVRDVVAHLVTVNQFFETSVSSGRDGHPTRMMASFDPAAHPSLFVEAMGAITATEVLEKFVASNDGFLGPLTSLTDDEWQLRAEAPVGHVSLERVVDHALWDAWVHERDIAMPLGVRPAEEADELGACLRYVAAASPALGTGGPDPFIGTVAVAATDPDIEFVVEVADSVAVHEEAAASTAPCLRGSAVELIEALSMRSPLPADAPNEWQRALQGLATAFATS